MLYLLSVALVISACVPVKTLFPKRSLRLPHDTLTEVAFVISGDIAEPKTVVLSFVPERRQVGTAQAVLRARLRVNTEDQVCEHDDSFKLQRRSIVGDLQCRAAPFYHDAIGSFSDKLYFFPRGTYCQVGRLVREVGNSYQVEFCGERDNAGGFQACVACEPSCRTVNTETVPQQNFTLKQAQYPFDPLSGIQIAYKLQVRTQDSLWQEKNVTLNGNGVLSEGRSCLFRDGCQVRSNRSDGTCVAPSR